MYAKKMRGNMVDVADKQVYGQEDEHATPNPSVTRRERGPALLTSRYVCGKDGTMAHS